MRERWLVAGLFLAALALVGLRVLPQRTTAAATRRESELVRASAERAARRRLPPTAARQLQAAGEGASSVRRVRREVLAVVGALPLSGVTLEVRESALLKPGVDVKLGAKGRFADLVDLTGRLSQTPGLALGVVRLGPREDVARLELEVRSR